MNEAAQNISETEGQIPLIGQEMERHRTEIPATAKTITDEARAFVVSRTDVFDKAGQTLQAKIAKTNSFVQQIRVQLATMNQSSGAPPTPGEGRSRTLLDPKTFSMKTYDGDKGEKEDFE